MTIRHDYEVSSEGAVRHWAFPTARLENPHPVPTEPAAILSNTPGTQLTGVVLSVSADDTIAVIDTTSHMVYNMLVHNVLTYSTGVEATWGAINIGDPVYYDRSATMPTGVYLSTSPQDNTGTDNPLFGFVVPKNTDVDMPAYPKGGATASTQTCGVMIIGG
ncbi:MAG: hypothetical protein GYA36_17375 [Veillonellaceae bacterium]|nr:hypothetical protein [Veillonellaceae bacterium]